MISKDEKVKVMTISEVPIESESIDIELIKLPKKWALWEGYENAITKEVSKDNKDEDWKSSINKVFEFQDIITFWQLWNNSIFSRFSEIFNNGERIRYFYEQKLRINSINFFSNDICPAWEDSENIGGHSLSFQYEIKIVSEIMKYLTLAENLWLNLIMNCFGEIIDGSEYINGIRFIDKSSFLGGRRNFFRFEIWVNKRIDSNEELYRKLKTRLCEILETNCNETKIEIKK